MLARADVPFFISGSCPQPSGLASGNPLGMDDDGDFRLSLAGAQEKMARLFRKGKWYEPKGQTATSHILKKKMGLLCEGPKKTCEDSVWRLNPGDSNKSPEFSTTQHPGPSKSRSK